MKNLMLKLMKEEDGAAMVEYILLIALIAVVAVGAIRLIGSNANTKAGAAAAELAK